MQMVEDVLDAIMIAPVSVNVANHTVVHQKEEKNELFRRPPTM